LVTTAPAPTTAPVPTVRPGRMMAPCPIHTSWPDDDQSRAAPREKFLLVALTGKIGACAIGHMRLRRPRHRMAAGIDARHGRDRAEPAEPGVSDLAVVDDVRVVAQRDFEQARSRTDLRIGTEPVVAHLGRRMDQRYGRERLDVHGAPRAEEDLTFPARA